MTPSYCGTAGPYSSFRPPDTWQIWIYRAAVFVVPAVVFVVARGICRELRANELRPFRGLTGATVRRAPEGGFVEERRRPGPTG